MNENEVILQETFDDLTSLRFAILQLGNRVLIHDMLYSELKHLASQLHFQASHPIFTLSFRDPVVELQVSVLPLLTILLSCSNRDSSKRDLNLRRLNDR